MNYFIGIGGTGSRVAEALVHLCASGYGPSQLKLFLIDPDQANGNLTRTKLLIASYQAARRQLATGDDLPFLRAEIETPSVLVWDIFGQGNTTLSSYVQLDDLILKPEGTPPHDLADFVSVLFNPAELNTPLNQGFRGHPSIGAAVMANMDGATNTDPWRTFWADVQAASQANTVRVFVAGSVFGGTGAAGVPTLGNPQLLKGHPDATLQTDANGRVTQSKIWLGGALVLPYFTFAPNPGDQSMHVTVDNFALATRAALKYYETKKLAFDQLYLVGDAQTRDVGAFSPGSAEQENRPHFTELVTALAATDFFEQPITAGAAGAHFTAQRPTKNVSWSDIPTGGADASTHRAALKRSLVHLTTFAHAMLAYGSPTLDLPAGEVLHPWHKELFSKAGWDRVRGGNTRDPRNAASREALKQVGEYLERYLRWIATLDDGGRVVQLVDGTRFFSGDPWKQDSGVRPLASGDQALGAFLREASQEKALVDYINALDAVAQAEGTGWDAHTPHDRFVRAFYKAACDFASANYALT